MPDRDFRFAVFRQINDGYRWRLRSANGETVELSEGGHPREDECVREVRGLKAAPTLVRSCATLSSDAYSRAGG
jgi:uncharacterized protein YegP (UPF0339 family)